LLEVYQVIDLKAASSSEKPTTRHTRVHYAIKGFKPDETIYRLKNEALPVEYNFTDLIGLELRQAQMATQGEKYEPVVELLVADRKFIFFLTDLEEIHYDS
jgi:hypothetical protein